MRIWLWRLLFGQLLVIDVESRISSLVETVFLVPGWPWNKSLRIRMTTLARDKADTIIDELQTFLNEHSGDDSVLTNTLSQTAHWTESTTSFMNGDASSDSELEKWPDSFSLGKFGTSSETSRNTITLTDQSISAQADEVVVSSASQTFSVRRSSGSEGIAINMGKIEEKVTSGERVNVKIHEAERLSSDTKSSSGIMFGQEQDRSVAFLSIPKDQSYSGSMDVDMDRDTTPYDFLQPTSSPPPPLPREFKDSSAIPFPMIFRRSIKDPGSKQYNELVKELEQVLDKRNKLRRSNSMDGLDDDLPPVVVGSLKASQKFSSSLDNLSIFSNKALLNKLETHFKNRGPFVPADRTFANKENGMGPMLSSASPTVMNTFSSDETVTRHISVNNTNSGWTNQDSRTDHIAASPFAASGDVSENRVDTNPPSSEYQYLTNGYPQSSYHHERHDAVSPHDISFSSEDEHQWVNIVSTLPTPNRYKKHHGGRNPASHFHHSRSGLIHSGSHSEVVHRAHCHDNLHHVTRVSVSKSGAGDPASNTTPPPPLPDGGNAFRPSPNNYIGNTRSLDRHGAVPMKTIIEQLNEIDSEDICKWDAAVRKDKKLNKDKEGVHRSISQRVVQKIINVIRPKSSSSTPVSRSNSFSPSADQKTEQHSAESSDSNNYHRMMMPPGESSDHFGTYRTTTATSSSTTDLSFQKHEVKSFQNSSDGSVVLELPNHHKMSIVPMALQMSDTFAHGSVGLSDGSFGLSGSNKVQQNTLKRASHDHMENDLTIQLPNSHKASIVPMLPLASGHSGSAHFSSTRTSSSVDGFKTLGNFSSPPGLSLGSSSASVRLGSSLDIHLPNNHKASIVPLMPMPQSFSAPSSTLPRNTSQSTSTSLNRVVLSRSSSSASSSPYNQTYRPAELGKMH